MPSFFNLFRRGSNTASESSEIIEELHMIKEQPDANQSTIKEITIDEDNSGNSLLYGDVQSITESAVTTHSPESLANMVSSDNIKTEQILAELKADYSSDEVFRENEEMARDSVVGSAMEIIADDACQVDEKTKLIVSIESDDEKLRVFLQDFLENNVNVEDRIWEWVFEVVKHGDFKLRRREYYIGDPNSGVKNVYYENVTQPYKVTRVEYMGKILGYRDEDFDENKVSFESPDTFVHFMSSKLSKREKVKLKVRNGDGAVEDVTCYKVVGTSIVDNARYIFRIVNLLDNMLVLSRVARSTQYNLVKVEVGNASPAKTQQILSDVRRRIEGSTKLKKNSGMKTDPSPIPVNSNVYIPTRDGKGDITIDSVNENVDVRSITDIDYFRDKEFATLKVPKQYVGFDEQMPGSLGNSSLAKLDIRYARSVQRVQTIVRYGIEELCNNYLRYRGRLDDIGKFNVSMRPISTAESAEKIEEHITSMQVFDSMAQTMESFAPYIDKAKLFRTLLNLTNISPSEIASKEFMQILDEMEKGTYDEDNHKVATEEDDGSGGEW
jgi:hypothetical protein